MSYNTKKLSGYSGSATEVNLPSAINGVLISAIASDVFTGKGVTKLTIDLPQSKVDQTGTPWGASSVVYGTTYNITCNLTNVTGRGTNPTVISNKEPATLVFDANSGYNLPDSVTVTGASYVWTKGTGTLILSSPTGNVSVIIEGTAKPTYNITTSLTNVTGAAANPTTIVQGGSANLTFTADTGYNLPDSITVTGASYTWTKSTGIVALSNATGAVSITIIGEAAATYGGLCFTANTGGSKVTLGKMGSPYWSGSYSTDGITWIAYTPGTTGDITLTQAGDHVYFKGTYTKANSTSRYLLFSMSGSVSSSGNIMSLCSGDSYESITKLPYNYMFYNLFNSCTSLTTAPSLPATTLTMYCYANMFQNCSSLTTAPKLSATTLAYSCYGYMFSGCTSLTTPPALPATTVEDSSYLSMFRDCTSLTTAPALPATTLADSCYHWMFQGCTALTTVPALPATTVASGCYAGMFQSCTSLYVSDTSTSSATHEWTIPTSGTFTNTNEQLNMFLYCLGTRSSYSMAGAAGQSCTYYTQNTPIA